MIDVANSDDGTADLSAGDLRMALLVAWPVGGLRVHTTTWHIREVRPGGVWFWLSGVVEDVDFRPGFLTR